MFLERLIARATGRLPVLRTSPSLAEELDHPAYGPPAEDEGDDGPMAAAADPIPRDVSAPFDRAEPVRAPDVAPQRDLAVDRTPAAHPRGDQAAAARADQTTPERAASQKTVPMADEPRPRTSARSPDPHPLSDTAPPVPQPIPNAAPAPAASARLVRDTSPPRREPDTSPVPALSEARPSPAEPPPAQLDPAPMAAPEPIEIHLEIGRIDLVSPQPARPQSATASRHARPGPLLSLTDYLDRRRGSR